MAQRASGAMLAAMIERTLFGLICLLIAVGLALPLAPVRVQMPEAVQAEAGDPISTAARDCGRSAPERAQEAACQPACPCGQALLAAYSGAEDSFFVILQVVVQPSPPERLVRPDPLPPKLPGI